MILTIRTDKPESELGLFDGQAKVAYETWLAHRQLAETIHLKIQKLLQAQGLSLRDLSAIVIYRGPGSFTGLRIGMSVANALAYGLKIPIAATTGQEWITHGIQKLLEGKGEQYVTPEYGAPVHITKPKK